MSFISKNYYYKNNVFMEIIINVKNWFYNNNNNSKCVSVAAILSVHPVQTEACQSIAPITKPSIPIVLQNPTEESLNK